MNRKLKKIMLLSGTYVVLMTALLIGVSTAKYTDSLVAYSSFGTAGYNVVLLGKDPETGDYTETDGSINNFGKTLLGSDYVPGMTYTDSDDTNTAKVFSFQVANGTTAEDASDVALDYTVTLRTTCNLPLSYKLQFGNTIYTANTPLPVDGDGNVVTSGTAELDENGIAWYEWSFRDIGNTAAGTGEVASAPVFSLCGGSVDSNIHAIIVEWPISVDSSTQEAAGNGQEYMKEIELLEVRITSAARNNTTSAPSSEDYVFANRQYSRGFIVLDPEKDVQVYEVDYRAFQPGTCLTDTDETGVWYEFTVDNGVSTGTEPGESETQYKVSVVAPMLSWTGAAGSTESSSGYVYELLKEERTAEEPFGTGNWVSLNRRSCSVWKYDVSSGEMDDTDREDKTAEYGTANQNTDISECSAESSSSRYYMEQRYRDTASSQTETVHTLENTEELNGVTVDAERYDTYHLEIPGSGTVPAFLQMNGRLKIVIEKVN